MTAGQFDYPVMLKLCDRLVVVVGAGRVGQRKISRLLQVGARVRVVDPCLKDKPYPAAAVESLGRGFESIDLRGALLVFACTDSSSVNQRVAEEAERQRILCCRTERPFAGDFILPAVLNRGRMTVAVSTGGSSPALAAEVRDCLAETVTDSWGVSLEVVAGIRRKWLTEKIDDQYNQQVLRQFWAERLLPLIEQGKMSEIDQLLIEAFGAEYSLELLQVQLPEGIE